MDIVRFLKTSILKNNWEWLNIFAEIKRGKETQIRHKDSIRMLVLIGLITLTWPRVITNKELYKRTKVTL